MSWRDRDSWCISLGSKELAGTVSLPHPQPKHIATCRNKSGADPCYLLAYMLQTHHLVLWQNCLLQPGLPKPQCCWSQHQKTHANLANTALPTYMCFADLPSPTCCWLEPIQPAHPGVIGLAVCKQPQQDQYYSKVTPALERRKDNQSYISVRLWL